MLEPNLSEALVVQGRELDETLACALFQLRDGAHELDEETVLQPPAM